MKKNIKIILLFLSTFFVGWPASVQSREVAENNNFRVLRHSEPLRTTVAKSVFFIENFESGIGSWTASYTPSFGSFTARNWVADITPPGGRIGTVAYAVSPSAGECGVVMENGIISLASPAVTIPAGPKSNYYVEFDHYFSLESGLDGGNLKYRINGGAWTLVPPSAIGINPYNSELIATESGSDNPMAGQSAYSGSGTSWRRTTVNISVLGAKQGDTVELRWDLGTDSCGGVEGWYIDNVEVYGVEIPLPPIPPKKPRVHFEKGEERVSEAGTNTPGLATNECLRYTDHKVKIVIDTVPSAPVTVLVYVQEYRDDYTAYADEGAKLDFQIPYSKVILQEGELSKEVTVRIYNDAQEEKDELILLNFSMTTEGNAEEGSPAGYNLWILDDDSDKRVREDDLFSENFQTPSIPEGWVTEGATEDALWRIRTFGNTDQSNDYGLNVHYVGSREYRNEFERYIDTPPFNFAGYSELRLSFDHILYVDTDSNTPTVEAEVWTGSSWERIWAVHHSSEEYAVSSVHVDAKIPIQHATDQVKVRFRFFTYNTGNWSIDNISIKGIKYAPAVQENVSTSPDQQYLGPNSTIYFYDPATNAILAKIKNLNSHDYGCTSVEIDRAGDGVSEWLGGFSITKKTLKVVPANPDPAGKYEITLYYSASELGEFVDNVTSMGKSEGGIGVSDAGSSVAVPVQVSKYNDDYAFTATFDTGFSGFGLSDAPPSVSLPVRLLSFEGKHTNEGNVLHWVCTEEVNNDHFVVQRSSDARKFADIGHVPAQAVLSSSNHYYFTDTDLSLATNYYRLKQVDKDGAYAYTNTIAVTSGIMPEAKLYPNPVHNILTIEIPDRGFKSGNLKIVNMQGIVVYKKENVVVKNGGFSQDIEKLQPGMYQVLLSSQGREYTFSIIKQ